MSAKVNNAASIYREDSDHMRYRMTRTEERQVVLESSLTMSLREQKGL